jgi:hypothetical protein
MQFARSFVSPIGRRVAVFSALFCVSCSGGGSSGLNPVQGQVLFKNEPAAGALVTFHPKTGNNITTVMPVGLVEKDGTFSVMTGKDKGAPAGEYTVTIIWSEEVPSKQKGKGMTMEGAETRDKLNGAYANRATSKFKVEIKSGANKLEAFQLQ